jgi:hypothetical protein
MALRKHAAGGRPLHRRRTISVLAIGISLALTVIAIPVNAPKAAADTAADVAMEQAQEVMLPVAESVDQVATGDTAFSNIAIDPTAGSVTVYRVGGASGAVVSQYQALSTTGAMVQVLGARLTATQAEALDQRINADVDTLAAQGIVVGSWGPDPYGGPYQIRVVGADQYRAALLARYADVGAGNLVVVEGQPPEASTRQDDSAPYWGGAWVRAAASYECSSGFAAHSRSNGADYMITAYHCVGAGDPRFWDGGNDFMGNVTSGDPDLDAAYIKVSSAPRVYDGAWNNSSSYSKPVIGIRRPTTGMRVCTSGSFSGVRCYGRILSTDHWRLHSRAGNAYTVSGWTATGINGIEMNGNGDSGGPVFAPSGGNVYAVGLISGQHTGTGYSVSCVGRTYSGRKCSNTVLFTNISAIASRRNLDLVH